MRSATSVGMGDHPVHVPGIQQNLMATAGFMSVSGDTDAGMDDEFTIWGRVPDGLPRCVTCPVTVLNRRTCCLRISPGLCTDWG